MGSGGSRPARLVVALGVLATQAGFAATSISFDSQPGDYIGGGRNFTLTPADGTIIAGRNENTVSVGFEGNTSWRLCFAAPAGATLTPGPYEGAERHPFQDNGKPGLSVSGDGRGCNILTGRFDIVEAVFGPGGEVQRFAADFEQHCEGGQPALFGNVRFNATSGTQVPGDCNQDGNLSIADATCILGILFLGEPAPAPCGEFSRTEGAHRTLLDWQPDGAVDISDPIALLRSLFFGGRPHALAPPPGGRSSCAFLAGCLDNPGCP